jgi:hypothetical protein
MNRDYYTPPKPGKFIQFFWKAAGADKYILEKSTYSDHIKYACLGGIVIATGVMAAIAGGYAFYTIFSPKGIAIDEFKTVSGVGGSYEPTDIMTALMSSVFGLIWGLIIFNIDRFIVTSTGKGDGTEAITRQELIGALPRIIMGTILALTISKPVEIRMFKSEIDVKLHEKQMEQQQAYKAKTDSLFNTELRKKDIELAKIENDIIAKKERYSDLEKQYIEEARIVTVGPRALAVKQQMQNVGDEIKAFENKPDYIRLKNEKAELERQREMKLNASEKVAAGLDGLLERLKIAHEIAGFWISTFITLLFMAIELTPIFFKLMLIKSPYDYMEDNIKELIKAENAIQVQYNYYQDKNGLERHMVTYHNAKRVIDEKIKLIKSQKKLSEQIVDKWESEQSSRIDNNINEFIQDDSQGPAI